MERFGTQRRVQIEDPEPDPPKYDDEPDETLRFKSSNSNVSDDQEPFMGIKVRRKASFHRDYQGDYLDVPSHPFLMKILQKQGKPLFSLLYFSTIFVLFILFYLFGAILQGIARFYLRIKC